MRCEATLEPSLVYRGREINSQPGMPGGATVLRFGSWGQFVGILAPAGGGPCRCRWWI